MKIDREMQDL